MIAMLPKDTLTKMLVQEVVTQLNAVFRTVEIFRVEMKCLAEQLSEYPVMMSLYGVGGFPWAAAHGQNWRREPFLHTRAR